MKSYCYLNSRGLISVGRALSLSIDRLCCTPVFYCLLICVAGMPQCGNGRQGMSTRRAHSRDDLKLAPALTLMSKSAATRQLCPADRSADAHLSCAAPAMPATPCRLTAARATSESRPGELIFDVVTQGSEPSGRYPSPRFSFLEPSVERKSRRVGAVVVRAWAR